MPRIQPVALLVEDDDLVSKSIQSLLERNQIKVISAADGQEALDLVDRTDFDIVRNHDSSQAVNPILNRISRRNQRCLAQTAFDSFNVGRLCCHE